MYAPGESTLLLQSNSLLDIVRDSHHECLARLDRLNSLLCRLNSTHSILIQTLDHLSSALSPQLLTLAGSQSDHLSAMVEASLVRISLLRVRAHQALYGAHPLHDHEADIPSAIGTVYRKLKADETHIWKEERSLDESLAEYDGLLSVVDGPQGAFLHIVNDWSIVKKEIDECRKDLTRLGWSGD